ncbi:MAG: hypothetical protein DBY17_03145 [Oscillospiraceae bacterium]|nr:MAG: hypothetical protein DBY17_03145 [Oscillospiraceae bacterium]
MRFLFCLWTAAEGEALLRQDIKDIRGYLCGGQIGKGDTLCRVIYADQAFFGSQDKICAFSPLIYMQKASGKAEIFP